MIKHIISILLIFSFLITRSQLPSGFPTQANTGWTQWGYQQSTKATIIANSDTNWTPRYPFTIIGWAHAGVDSAYWMWNGVRWEKISAGSVATNNTNIGSGFRPVNELTQQMRTYFGGFGIKLDTVANANGMTWRADTTRVTGLPTYYYVDSSVNGNGGRKDSSQFSVHPIYFGRVSQINFFGNSITQYQNALPYDSAYDLLIADTLKAYWQNYALSGMGIFYNTSKHDSIISGVNNNAATLTMTGYNDTRAVSINYRTYKKIASGTKAMFLNHFANYYLPASTTPSDTSITRYGTWTVGQNATQWSGKTKNAAYTSTLNDSIVWKSQPATSIGINLIAGDSTTYNHSIVELFIDGVSQGQFNTNNIADDAAAVGSGDTRISYPIIVGGLTSACHTVKLVNKANRIMYVDYFSTLDQKKPAFVIFHLINPLPIQDTANIALDSMVATLPSGFPVLVVKTENFWNKVTGMSGDGIHPNNLGHHQIYMAFRSVYDSVVNSQGTLAFDGRNLWISGGGSMQKILNASDAWTKGDAAINVAGYINLPYNMSIKQNGTDILKTSEDNQSTFVGYKAGYLQTTALGNTGIGYKSLFSLTTGNANTGIGQLSLASVTSGIQNTAIGYQAAFNYMGDGTVAIGLQALFSNTTGMHNTAIGKGALFGNTGGSDNTALGFNTLSAGASGDENTVIGYNAMPVLTGSGNSVLGVHALETTTTGSYNSAIGRYAMAQNTTGTGNVAIGNGALYGASAGGSNYCVALGYGSLGNITGGANGNIGIGYQAGNNISSGTNNIIIGYNVSAPLATGNNQLNIGNVIFGSGLTGTGTLIAGSIGIGLNTPSARLHLPGGTSVANTAPFKIDSGIVLSSPEKGAIESDGDSLYWTNRSLIRIALNRTNTNLTLQQVLTNGSTLTTTNTIAAGNNIQTLTGTQASSSNYAYSFQNTSGNGGALGATAGGTGASLSGNNSSSGDGVFANSTSGTGMHATSTSGTAGNFRIGPSSTNTTVKVLDITRGTSGTAADGIGGYIDLNATTDAANDDPAVRFVWKFTTAADATRRGQFEIWQATTTSMSRFLTITGTGQLQLPFYGTGTFTGTPTTIPAFTSGGDVVEKTVSILSHSITTPATGGTVNLVNNQYNIINPSGTIATLTVNLPSSPADNDRVEIKYTQAVTTVTYGNGTVVDGIASPISGQLVVLVYDSSAGKWY